MPPLEDLERDLLQEAFNIGLGEGSAALSALLGEEVHVTVPFLAILPKRPAIDEFDTRFKNTAHTIRQTFISLKEHTAFSGDAFLFIPEVSSKTLTAFLGDTDVNENDILAELGNLVLHACLGSLANMLGTEIDTNLPEVYINRTTDVLVEIARSKNNAWLTNKIGVKQNTSEKRKSNDQQDRILQLGVRFKTMEKEISGDIMFFLDLVEIPHLKKQISNALKRLIMA